MGSEITTSVMVHDKVNVHISLFDGPDPFYRIKICYGDTEIKLFVDTLEECVDLSDKLNRAVEAAAEKYGQEIKNVVLAGGQVL